MHITRESGRQPALFVALIALVAAAALILVGAGHAGATGKAKMLKYVGTSPKAPGATLILEGPVSKKAKKGAWPSQVTATFKNATAMCEVEPGVEVPRKLNETLVHYPMGVSPQGNAAHPHNPTFELNEEFGGGENSPEPENPYPETEIFFYGEFSPNGTKGHVSVTYSYTVPGAEIGSKEAESVCELKGGFTVKRVK